MTGDNKMSIINILLMLYIASKTSSTIIIIIVTQELESAECRPDSMCSEIRNDVYVEWNLWYGWYGNRLKFGELGMCGQKRDGNSRLSV